MSVWRMETKFVKFVLKFRSVSTPFCQEHSSIYNSFPRLYRAISIRTKGFQSLAKFTKSSDVNQVHVFEQKTGFSTKDINLFGGQFNVFGGLLNLFGGRLNFFGGLLNLFGGLFNLFGGNKTSLFGGMMSLIASTIYETCCSSQAK